MESLRAWLIAIGWSPAAARFTAIVAAVAISYLAGWVVRRLADAPITRRLQPSEAWNEAADRWRLARRGGHVVAVLVAMSLVLPLLASSGDAEQTVTTLLEVLLTLAIASALSGLLGAWVDVLSRSDGTEQRLPFKVLGQGVRITIWTYAWITVLSIVTRTDVPTVLAGLTALGAIMVYIFRDPLLGWTAGVAIAASDLVRQGDWITAPRHHADGIVVEISLLTVQVQNWDQTISVIPTYALTSEGFRNSRGMYESGGRRIRRSILIDVNSVRF